MIVRLPFTSKLSPSVTVPELLSTVKLLNGNEATGVKVGDPVPVIFTVEFVVVNVSRFVKFLALEPLRVSVSLLMSNAVVPELPTDNVPDSVISPAVVSVAPVESVPMVKLLNVCPAPEPVVMIDVPSIAHVLLVVVKVSRFVKSVSPPEVTVLLLILKVVAPLLSTVMFPFIVKLSARVRFAPVESVPICKLHPIISPLDVKDVVPSIIIVEPEQLNPT